MNKADGDPCQTMDVASGECVGGQCEPCSADIVGCRQIGWVPMTLPESGETFAAVWAGSSDGWAGGSSMAYYNGAAWTDDATFASYATTGGVKAISATTSAHAFALVGKNGAVYHRSAGAWLATQPPDQANAIWADGDDDAFAAGLLGKVDRYSITGGSGGSGAWVAHSTAGTGLVNALWGTSDADLYAVNTAGGVWHYDGTAWSQLATLGSGAATSLAAVWGSGTDVYVSGAPGIFHKSGSGSFVQEAPDNADALWGSGPDDVFAGTAAGILHSDGASGWLPMTGPAMVTSLSGGGLAEVLAANDGAIARYTGAAWSPLPMPATTSNLTSASAFAPDQVVVGGVSGAAELYLGGSAWAAHDDDAPGFNLYGLYATSATSADAVGGAMIQHWNGTAWVAETNPSSDPLVAIAAAAGVEYAAGGSLISGGGSAWTDLTSLGTSMASAVWAADAAHVFVAGSELAMWNGSSLQAFANTTGTWTAIWGASATDVYAAGASGAVSHFDGTAWTALTTGTSANLDALWGTSDDDLFASGTNGTVLHYHLGVWSTVSPPNITAELTAIAGSGSTIFFAGDAGTCVRLIETAP